MTHHDVTGLMTELVTEFWVLHRNARRSMLRRDNCGETACKLMWFLQSRGIDAERVQGEFLTDYPVYEFWDFTDQQRMEMRDHGLNPRRADDRYAYMTKMSLNSEHCRIPHYWLLVEGEIVDPSGNAQFLRTGLSSDLNPSRYDTSRQDVKLDVVAPSP